MSIWQWLGNEVNARAMGAIVVGIPAALAAWTFIYTTLWPEPDRVILIPATEFWTQEKVNVAPTNHACYAGLVLNQPPYQANGNSATYRVALRSSGRYQLLVEYAAEAARPIKVEVNGVLMPFTAAGDVSGKWCNTHVRWDNAGEMNLKNGENFIRLYTEGVFPHLKTIKLVRL
jgi:hypothetical protein